MLYGYYYASGKGTPVGTKTSLVPDWFDGVSVGNIDSSAAWQEISGGSTARLPANANYAFTVSDSPGNQIAVMSLVDASAQGVITLTSSTAKVDLEEMSSQTVGGVHYQYVFDMGNNSSGANSRGVGIDLRIFRFVEPAVTGSNISTSDYIEIDCVFPSGDPPTSRDCEAGLIDENGTIFIITKRDATQKVYSLAHSATYTGIQTLTYEGAMTSLPASTTVPLGATSCYAVGACMSPNGKEILVKNYSNVYYFSRNPNTQTVIQALQGTETAVKAYVGGGSTSPKTSHPSQEPQGETIFYSQDGRDFFTCSEFLSGEGSTSTRFPLFKYVRASATPTEISFQTGVAPTGAYAGTQDTYIWNTNSTTNYGTEATFVCDNPLGSDSRVGLLKFDLSDIPSTATIVGSHLFMNIANEGQGVYLHRIIDSVWAEGTVTWANIDNGPPAIDDVFAVSTPEVIIGINLDTVGSGIMQFNVAVDTVQGWVNGTYNNHGWLIPAIHATDGMQFDSNRALTSTNRPKLVVRYI